jgi:hypothetical protein
LRCRRPANFSRWDPAARFRALPRREEATYPVTRMVPTAMFSLMVSRRVQDWVGEEGRGARDVHKRLVWRREVLRRGAGQRAGGIVIFRAAFGRFTGSAARSNKLLGRKTNLASRSFPQDYRGSALSRRAICAHVALWLPLELPGSNRRQSQR